IAHLLPDPGQVRAPAGVRPVKKRSPAILLPASTRGRTVRSWPIQGRSRPSSPWPPAGAPPRRRAPSLPPPPPPPPPRPPASPALAPGGGAPPPAVDELPVPPALASPLPAATGCSRGFDPGDRHFGLDLVAPPGSPILASAAGVVVRTAPHPDYGQLVVLRH